MAPVHSRTYRELGKQTGPPCAPLQRAGQEFHVVYFDINGGVDRKTRSRRARQYSDGILRRIARAEKIGPVCYYDKPVTPMHNPENPRSPFPPNPVAAEPRVPNRANRNHQRRARNHGNAQGDRPRRNHNDPLPAALDPFSGHSYHVIEMLDSGSEHGKRVQLLIRDFDQYLVAFRRYKYGHWSAWFHFLDHPLPPHFGAVNMGITGDHAFRSLIGGDAALDDMFHGLADYPEHMGDKDQLRRSLLRAAVMFCGAMRLRLVFHGVSRLLLLNKEEAGALTDRSWDQIGCWGNLSEFVLTTAKKNRGKVIEDTIFNDFVTKGVMTTFEMLVVSPWSELMLLMRKDEVLLPKGIPKSLMAPGAGLKINDPDFDPEEDLDVIHLPTCRII